MREIIAAFSGIAILFGLASAILWLKEGRIKAARNSGFVVILAMVVFSISISTEPEGTSSQTIQAAPQTVQSVPLFICNTDISGQQLIMSFDKGHNWLWDDGRCARQQAEETRLKAEQARLQQKAKDDDAQMYSYWPTTIRVDTDMDSFWLNKEERTCQTYPDTHGKIAVVACNSGSNHREHNIPVKFWGGVERGTISDWKCMRESDDFVCRAIN